MKLQNKILLSVSILITVIVVSFGYIIECTVFYRLYSIRDIPMGGQQDNLGQRSEPLHFCYKIDTASIRPAAALERAMHLPVPLLQTVEWGKGGARSG